MFDKIISLTQPKDQFIQGKVDATNPYYDPEKKHTIYSFVLQNESIEEIDELYMLVGNSIEHDRIDRIMVLETEEELNFKILTSLKGKVSMGFNYLNLSFIHTQKKLRLLTIEITLKGEFQRADLSKVKNIFTLSIRNKLLPFYGDKFFVPRIKHKKEMKLNKSSWKELRDDGVIILNYLIEIINFTGTFISKLKINEEFFICKSLTGIQKLEINDASIQFIEDGDVYRFKKLLQNLASFDRRVIYYKIYINEVKKPGIYNFPSITKLTFGDNLMEKSTSLQLRLNKIEVDSSCITLNNSNIQFLVGIRNDENSPSSELLIKNTLIIPKGIKIQLDQISHMEIWSLGELVENSPDYLTDTILELKFKRRVMSNSEIEIPIGLKVVEIEGERTSNYIKNIVEEVKILSKNDGLNIIHYKNKKAYLKITEN